MKKLTIALFAIAITAGSKAQIIREQTTPQTIGSQIPGYSKVTSINTVTVSYTPPTPVSQPTPINGDTTTEGNGVYDFGSIVPVTFSVSNGNITTTSAGKVWTLRISVPNALSIGLTFSQFNLSSSAEMFIYNDGKTVLNKRIKKEHFTNSDTVSISSINGNAVIVYILEPNNFGNFQSMVSINQIVGGYQEISDVGDIGSGALQQATINCIPHIQCYSWRMMSARAIARIEIPRDNNRVGLCTGTLINNEQNNGRAYLLTAFHCVDANSNNILDANEIQALRQARFQFQFWRTQCNGNINNDGIQFNGAILRTQNRGSDMVLLELINQPGIGDGVNYAGWSRQTGASSNSQSFIIHHPRGEDMRHTQTRFVRNYILNSNYWQAGYSSGVVDRGSSGSALFNEQSQIIGQLKAGWSSCNYTDFSDRYGKFSRSWDNGNLQPWLSPLQNNQAASTLALFPLEIQGSETISCTNPNQYSVPPGLEGCTYQWSVSNNLQIVSGQNTASINVVGIPNSNFNYTGTITCTLRTPGKGRTRILVTNKTVTLSVGSINGYYTTGNSSSQYPLQVDYNGDNPVDPGYSYVTITSPEITTQTWTLQYGNPTSWQFNAQSNKLEMLLPVDGWALFRLNSPTTCGNAQFEFLFIAGGSFYRMSPNPATNNITISVDEEKLSKQKIQKSNDQDIREVLIADKMGIIKQRFVYGQNTRQINLNVSSLNPGFYLARINNGKSWTTLKFIKE